MHRRTRDQKLEGAYFDVDRDGGYWVLIPFAPGWIAAQRLTAQAGGIVVSEVRVYPDETAATLEGETKPVNARVRNKRVVIAGAWSGQAGSVPSGGVSSTLLRRLPLGGHATAPVVADFLSVCSWARTDGEALKARVERDLGFAPVVGRPEPHLLLPPPVTRGRKRLPEAFLRSIADDYNRLLGAGHRDVAQRLAAERGLSRNQTKVRTWIRIARKRGLLQQTTMGKLPAGSPAVSRPTKRRAARPL
jgi:hypothetical protein